jgi:Zn-dependent M28 family amino/carboxypeptidase
LAPPSAREIVERFSALDPPRNIDHPESLDRAAEWIFQALEDSGLEPTYQRYRYQGARYQNVTALIGSGARPRLVVGAHYDVCGDQPGADDNASGIAALLMVATQLAKESLDADVELVAFTLEEPPAFRTPYMGSAQHARALAEKGVEVIAMISLEMLGFYSEEPGSQEFPVRELGDRFPSEGDFLAVIGRENEADLLSRIAATMNSTERLQVFALAAPPTVQGIDYSDHMNYWRHGFPALMVTDTAFFRNPHYHLPSDRPETLDYARLDQAIQALIAAIIDLAGAHPISAATRSKHQ